MAPYLDPLLKDSCQMTKYQRRQSLALKGTKFQAGNSNSQNLGPMRDPITLTDPVEADTNGHEMIRITGKVTRRSNLRKSGNVNCLMPT